MKSQEQQILSWLKRGRGLTPIQALEKFGCFRLGSRIHDLRMQGWDILTEMVTQNGKRFARYKLNAG